MLDGLDRERDEPAMSTDSQPTSAFESAPADVAASGHPGAVLTAGHPAIADHPDHPDHPESESDRVRLPIPHHLSSSSSSFPAREGGWGVRSLLARMTPAEKVGQLLMPIIFPASPADLTLTPDLIALLDDYPLGGYFITAGGGDAHRVRAFTAALRAHSRIPLILASDFEGGAWNFLASAAGPRPSAATVGATGDPAHAHAKGITDAVRLGDLGLNMNFAPVVDVLTNPANPIVAGRAFGPDPALVTRMAAAYLDGLASVGIAGCLKHFPGLGAVSTDPHHTLPTLHRTPDELRAVELLPFRDLIQTGHAHSIMTTHIHIPALDPDLPTSVSPIAIAGLLRRELGYGGLVISDSVSMGALTARYPIPEASLLAFQAGTDLILGAPDLATTRATHAHFLEALAAGRITHQRLDTSVRRILRFKARWAILPTAESEHASPATALAAVRAG
jgi:beta-N-acetylhexosaminidase